MTLNIKPREFEFEYNRDHSKEWVTLIKLPSDVSPGDRCKTVDRESFDLVVRALEKAIEHFELTSKGPASYAQKRAKLALSEIQAILGGEG